MGRSPRTRTAGRRGRTEHFSESLRDRRFNGDVLIKDGDHETQLGHRVRNGGDVERTHVEHTLVEGHHDVVSEQDLTPVLVEQSDVGAHGGVLLDLRVGLGRTGHRLTPRGDVDVEGAVVVDVGGGLEERRQRLDRRGVTGRHVGQRLQQLLVVDPRQSTHLVDGRHGGVLGGDHQIVGVGDGRLSQSRAGRARPGRRRDLPLVRRVVEGGRHGDVVATNGGGLSGEDVLGVAQVLLNHRRHRRERVEHTGEDRLVGPNDGIGGVHHVVGHLAGVGVDDDLHRVAHVVKGVGQTRRTQSQGVGVLGVGVLRGRGVAVEYEVDVAVRDDRVGLGVEGEEGGGLLSHGGHVANEEDPGVGGDLVGDEKVEVTQSHGEGQPREEPPHPHAPRARVVRLDVRPTGELVVDLGLLGVSDHPAGVPDTEVDPGLGEGGQTPRRDRGEVRHVENRVTRRGVDLVGREQGDAVTVGVLQVSVHPPGRGQRGGGDFAGTDEHRGEGTVHLVAIDAERREGVVRANRLAANGGGEGDLGIGVPESNVGERRGVGLEDRARDRRGSGEGVIRHLGQAPSLSSRVDITSDVGGLEGALGRRDLEGLQEGRVQHPDHERDEGPESDGDGRKGPAPHSHVRQQNHRGGERQHDEDRERGHPRVNVGVARALHVRVGRGHEVPAGDDVPGGLKEGDEGPEHTQVSLHSRGDRDASRPSPNAAVQEVGEGGQNEGDEERDEAPGHHEGVEGQGEDVEADVLVKEGIDDPEGLGVAVEEPDVPLTRRVQARHRTGEHRHHAVHQGRPGANGVLEASYEFVVRLKT